MALGGFTVPGLALAAPAVNDGIGRAFYTTEPARGSVPPPALGNAPASKLVTVPTWTDRFSTKLDGKRKVFTYTMVGSNPWVGSAVTRVATEIIPLALIFSSGATLDGASQLASTIASPIFRPFRSQVGFTQYGDAIFRASFYSVVKSTSPTWHVLLGEPSVLPTQTITVPAEAGLEFMGSISGAPVGLVDMDWFSKQVETLIKTLDIDPRTLPIFLTYNTFLFSGSPDKCCVIGFHSALTSPGPGNTENVNTFIWASYSDRHVFGAPLEDITALSHEVAEWYSDPLISNVVPRWVQPESSVCFSNLLEVGDALQAFAEPTFVVKSGDMEYHPQDVALFSWFAGQSPSIGFEGRYSYRGGKLLAPAATCPVEPVRTVFTPTRPNQ